MGGRGVGKREEMREGERKEGRKGREERRGGEEVRVGRVESGSKGTGGVSEREGESSITEGVVESLREL